MNNMEEVKYALSIKQPWAELIALGYKDVENREWYTAFRGPFFIHASKNFDDDGFNWIKSNFPEINLPSRNEFLLGGLIGVSEIKDCVKQSSSPWFFGTYGFVLSSSKKLEKFIPMKGKLGFFKIKI